jgi:hypothetical protein
MIFGLILLLPQPKLSLLIYRKGGRPKGIIRDHLTEQKISEILILEEILSLASISSLIVE